MLKHLHLRNFTVFADADFEFGPGLNVIVGANGTGKSHVLKAAYSVICTALTWIRESKIDEITGRVLNLDEPDSAESRVKLHKMEYKIKNVFQPVPFQSNELIRRGSAPNEGAIEIAAEYPSGIVISAMVFTSDGLEVNVSLPPQTHRDTFFEDPIFIPAKEVLTTGWLLSLYSRREIAVDETYPDLLRLLMGPPLRHPEPLHIVEQLQQLIGGKVEEEGGHFYLSAPEQPRMEMNLVAEGVRKFATLYKLLANGTLTPETTLFWDEPEANLNPALLKEMAAVLAELARAGFQIILATHSLFLLKEFHILSKQEKLPVQYFGLSAEAGEATTVTPTDDLELLPNIIALDAELDQSDRFQRVLDQEDADRN